MHKYKILVIEDEKEYLELLKVRLESEGYEVLTAMDGQVGIAKAKESMPDLIISDIIMPKKDGFEVLREIRNDMVLKRIPFIMLTALDDFQRVKQAYQYEADFYIEKSTESFLLLKNIQVLLHLAKSRI
jgi:two-component system alkaline phosphatase synthesis response regulator PhoP